MAKLRSTIFGSVTLQCSARIFQMYSFGLRGHLLNTQIYRLFSSDHEIRSINDLFRSHDYIRPVVSLIVVQVFLFRSIDSEGVGFGL
jgi:hypothetical protein